MTSFKTPMISLLLLALPGCSGPEKGASMAVLIGDAPYIEGNAEYLDSPFVTAGDRVYLVGHQNGSFPELGWHIPGEMGGIWNHPVKLMDGFGARIRIDSDTVALDNASNFVNYPFANKHLFSLDDRQLQVERWQFVPDRTEGLLVQYVLTNTAGSGRELDFEFTAYADLCPTWLGDQSGMIDSRDEAEYLGEEGAWMVKDQGNPWFVCFGADRPPGAYAGVDTPYKGLGLGNSLRYTLEIPPGASRVLNFAIAGSLEKREAALETFSRLKGQWPQDLLAKKTRYERLASQSKLRIPDQKLQQAFEWLKYNCDWLVQTVPGIGTGITAGIPDYPWWFGVDSEYALKGYMAVGQKDAVYQTIALLDSVSEKVNGNGRILHEMSTNGVVFNKGNINETPQFASLIWEIYQWSGDVAFLRRYFPTIKKGLLWLMEENDLNKNLFPDGFGMMEIHGLDSEMIDVASYTQRAFSDAAQMAEHLGDTALALGYRQTADRLKAKINAEFWSPAFGSYADFLGTDAQALHLIEDAMVRADTLEKPWAVDELKQTAATIRNHPSEDLRPFVVHHNWVVNTPMEMKIADSAKALQALDSAKKFMNPYGMFVTGIDRDASAGADEGSFKGSKVFSYTGAVMTLPTGVQAVAENNYGRPDEALDYLQRMSRSFSYALPGSMYEVSPDYGMMTQAWNIYSFAVPIVQQFFGIQPRAYDREVIIRPRMPSSWERASLENVLVADNQLSVYFERKEGKATLRVEQDAPGWTLTLVPGGPATGQYQVLEGEVQQVVEPKEPTFRTQGKVLELQWEIP